MNDIEKTQGCQAVVEVGGPRGWPSPSRPVALQGTGLGALRATNMYQPTSPNQRSANDPHRPYLVQSGITTTELAQLLADDQPRLRVGNLSHRLRRGHSSTISGIRWGSDWDDLRIIDDARQDVRRFGIW